MRIFQVLESFTNERVPWNKTWYRNLYEPLIDLGHEVVLFPSEMGREALSKKDQVLRKEFSTNLVKKFTEEHNKNNFDLVFFYLMDGMFEPWAIDEIRSRGVFACNFSCNNIHQFYLVKDISSLFDLNLYSEKRAGEKFDAIGASSFWWPMASNPKYFHPIDTKRTVDVSFVGACYGSRLESVYQLLLSGLDVHVYGPGWKNDKPGSPLIHEVKALIRNPISDSMKLIRFYSQGTEYRRLAALRAAKKYNKTLHGYAIDLFPDNFHKPVSDDDLVELYSKSVVSLGFLDVFDRHDPTARRLRHLHLRDFEAPMCGALYCTDYLEEYTEMFEPGKEVVLSHDIFDRIEKVGFYFKNPKSAEKIRKAGLRRALAHHTYHSRFKALFKHLGLN